MKISLSENPSEIHIAYTWMENTESLKTPEWFESVEDAVVVNNGGWGGGSLLQS